MNQQQVRNGLFLHGGPGMNSFAERVLFRPKLLDRQVNIHFWNEPSKLRPDSSLPWGGYLFKNWLNSAAQALEEQYHSHGKVLLLAHSFGCHGALALARDFPDLIDRTVLINPGLAIFDSIKNILGLAKRDFEISAPHLATQIQTHCDQSSRVFDHYLEQAFQIALTDQNLLLNYWANPAFVSTWMQCLAHPEAQLDLESFLGILKTFTFDHLAPPIERLEIPCHLIFSNLDRITLPEKELTLANSFFKSVSHSTIENSGHFAHLETPTEVAYKIVTFLS